MLFNSLAFAAFLPITLALYCVVPRRWQNPLLLIASWVFYGWWDVRFLGLLVLSTAIDFGLALGFGSSTDPKRRKVLMAGTLVLNLGILGFFKYWGFFAESLQAALASVGVQSNLATLNVVLPVGISFYTFQTMSYTLDVALGKLKPTRDFIAFAAYVAFFPQLVAGPIERASHLLPQIEGKRTLSLAAMEDGARLMLWGFFKKLVIADNLAGDVVAGYAPGAGPAALVIATYAFAFQIYCDFSGYSDIARGCARLFGFELMENFRAPYLATSLRAFWQRWHISLSTWFREYVYVPLGGNRRGPVRQSVNLLTTFLLSGLWHGAAWHFVAWGAVHGAAYVPGAQVKPKPRGPALQVLGWLLTFHFVVLTWLFFRAPDLPFALHGLAEVARWAAGSIGAGDVPALAFLKVLVLGGGLLAVEFLTRDLPHPLAWDRAPALARTAATLVVFGMLVLFGNVNHVAFIYFQF